MRQWIRAHSGQWRGVALLAMVVVGCIVATAWAFGPDILENDFGDAGSLPENALGLEGNGPINSIGGRLTGAGPGPGGPGDPDFEDMYLIQISDVGSCPGDFTASTQNAVTTFNTQLFLFSADELGLLANDDVTSPPIVGPSELRASANDGSAAMITTGGLYYLAISGFNNDPFTDLGFPIFDQASTFEISGPDGIGGSMPIGGWAAVGGETGDYVITFDGTCAQFIPPPVPASSSLALILLAVLLIGAAATVMHRRRPRAQRLPA